MLKITVQFIVLCYIVLALFMLGVSFEILSLILLVAEITFENGGKGMINNNNYHGKGGCRRVADRSYSQICTVI